ncbi:protein phosphatase 1 regulatory subunit 3B-like isoform X2 [Acipenser oxyrinchus oxyrinchus]|uniref:Protein phosphatase 1 regulatory subunit n=1 Tax=Acipenser oxyrinchus oxyrinchus TaxID=40147 RepID=A0AAD8GI44_ACIOX|nr:protein phosphatase 1 regulatory subunit 3B-like isoform X2 [Acipenser oxyrinchus oxyrinchus]
MNCTSIFSFFSHKSTLPVELAMPLYMASDDFIYKRRPKRTKPLRPCIQCSSMEVKHKEASTSTSTEGECRAKKRVSFADHKGLALTMVKIFSEFDDSIEIPYNIQELIDKVVNLSVERDSLVLDFEQPSADYLAFRQRLENDHVCLENCMLKEKTLVGTVKVKNLAFEKSVKLRVTFNTWKSFIDHQCQFVNDIYTGSDRDTFSFEIDLPHNIPPHERIEFALCYTSNGKDFWDSNQGQNYKVIRSVLKTSPENGVNGSRVNGLSDVGIHFDPYGSPRCSYGIFPEWPSYEGFEKIGPYY